jgi:succinate-semialdehyde dehydrogenase/glutarate-semialdehyde dehydrogenase
MAIESRNPSTGEELARYEALDGAGVEERLRRAVTAFRVWKNTSFEQRARLMTRAAELLEVESQRFAHLITLEVGKPLRASVDEVLKSARGCRYYAQNAQSFLADEIVPTEAMHSYLRYEPCGPVLAIMPWNFPFWQVFRFAAPALMAGNVALMKHAPNVPQCALAIEEAFQKAGFPEGVFQTLLLETEQVAGLLEDRRVSAVTLTGSAKAGEDVASRAGRALKKSVLELGGSDPFIVMPTANLTQAVTTAIKSRTMNAGQSCIAAKRFILDQTIAEEFLRNFVAAMEALKVGDPLEPDTDIGPLARADLVDTLDAQVNTTVAMGARILTGGARLVGRGNYYPPTVLVEIPKDSPAYREELFGPVASMFRVDGVEAAIQVANDTCFGLGASVWTSDVREQTRFINELEAGQVFVNAAVASDPRLPFGGIKMSGFGRELGILGIREFVNVKTVWLDHM